MATNLNPSSDLPPVSQISSVKNLKIKPFSVRLGMWQVLALWAVVSVLLYVVFRIGLEAGRNQGFRNAFELYAKAPLRHPVPGYVPSSDLTSNGDGNGDPGLDDFSVQRELETFINSAGTLDPKTLDPKTLDPETLDPETLKNPKTLDEKTPGRAPAKAGNSARAEEKPVVAGGKGPILPIDNSLSKGWYVQVSAADENSKAFAVARKLRAAGLSAYIHRAIVNNRLYFRVLVGPYSSSARAEATRGRVGSLRLNEGRPFLRKIP